jgi:hypothetical protein
MGAGRPESEAVVAFEDEEAAVIAARDREMDVRAYVYSTWIDGYDWSRGFGQSSGLHG